MRDGMIFEILCVGNEASRQGAVVAFLGGFAVKHRRGRHPMRAQTILVIAMATMTNAMRITNRIPILRGGAMKLSAAGEFQHFLSNSARAALPCKF